MNQTPTITFEQVQEVIDQLRPAVQRDGGDIQLIAVEGNDARIQLVGHCVGCPSSMVTLKLFIEERLREEIPGFGEVLTAAVWVY
jgi:Fe-S cluster biogenesis protein NfuA